VRSLALTPTSFARCLCRPARVLLVASIAAVFPGCWMPPSASVRPHGEPRVIADGIAVEQVVDSARVESVDRSARTLTLSLPGTPLRAYQIGRGVRNWSGVHAGGHVDATLEERLTVYVPPVNESGKLDGEPRSRPPDARVLSVDPSYRVLVVKYPSGRTETFKVAMHTSFEGIEAGDSVWVRPVEVIELRAR